MVAVLGTAFGAASAVLVGLVLAAMFNLPPSFLIVSLSFAIWLVAIVISRDRHGTVPASIA